MVSTCMLLKYMIILPGPLVGLKRIELNPRKGNVPIDHDTRQYAQENILFGDYMNGYLNPN